MNGFGSHILCSLGLDPAVYTVPRSRAFGVVSNTTPRRDNFHLQALNTCLL